MQASMWLKEAARAAGLYGVLAPSVMMCGCREPTSFLASADAGLAVAASRRTMKLGCLVIRVTASMCFFCALTRREVLRKCVLRCS